jgi:uncharacterized protein YggE
MTTATIAVKGSASDDFPADYALVQFGCEFNTPARSEALAGGNSLIAAVRDTAAHLGDAVREIKVATLRVHETFNFVGSDNEREHAGWVAQLDGRLLLEPNIVPVAIAALIKTGVRVDNVSWRLDRDNELEARRAVRHLAVADAKDAAHDFALALGANLGNLLTLADPGLLGAASFADVPRRSAQMLASAASRPTWDEFVDIDRELITISAHVEASYEVILHEE